MKLEKIVIRAGNDYDYSTKGDIVEVHYTGWLYLENAADNKGHQYATAPVAPHLNLNR